MKNLIFILFAISMVFTACSSVDTKEKEMQDSLAAAAAADSILNSALAADTLGVDSLSADSATIQK